MTKKPEASIEAGLLDQLWEAIAEWRDAAEEDKAVESQATSLRLDAACNRINAILLQLRTDNAEMQEAFGHIVALLNGAAMNGPLVAGDMLFEARRIAMERRYRRRDET
jgi:hypothetical protein